MPVLAAVLVLTIAFPYVQPLPSDSYTQPYPLFVASLILLVTGARGLVIALPSDRFALIGLAACGLLAFLLSAYPGFGPQELKYLLNYLTPLIIAPAVLVMAREQRRAVDLTLRLSAALWLGIAAIQALKMPDFATGVLGAWSQYVGDIAASGRGAVGLAPEPTHHAFHMISLGAALALMGRRFWALLCLASALLLARSASGAMVLALALPLAILFSRRIGLVLGGIALALGGLALLWLAPEGFGGRMVELARQFLADPASILMADYSVNMRLGGMLSSMLWQISEFFMPHGLSLDAWLEARQAILASHGWVVDLSGNGVPSGWGILTFQLGLLAFPLIAALLWRFYTTPRGLVARWALYSVPLIYLFQYNISAPQFSLVYGLCMATALARQAPAQARAHRLDLLAQDWARLRALSGQPPTRLRPWHLLSPRFLPNVLLRMANIAHETGHGILAKFLSLLNFVVFNLEVPARLRIGPGLVLPHPQGTVLGAAEIGSNVTIFHQVTLGARAADFGYDLATRPIIGDNVTLSVGAKILGPVTIGAGATVGANAVVVKDVPAQVTVVGIPAKPIGTTPLPAG